MSEDLTLMLVGPGNLGGLVLDLLARRRENHRIVVVGRSKDKVARRANTADLVALQLGYSRRVEYAEADLLDTESCSELIRRVHPDVIFHAASLQSWWVIGTLPRSAFEVLELSRVGPWLPMHLTLAYKLMLAVAASGVTPRVVNAAYPDVVNPILSRIGLAPMIGIGNVANAVPALRRSIADKLDVSVERVEVRLFAHHYVSYRVSRTGNPGEAPFHLTALVDGADMTDHLDLSTVFDLLPGRYRRVGGRDGQSMTAASAMTVLNAMLDDSGAVCHAPAPNGLPGGYAVRVTLDHVHPALPPGLELSDAVAVNEIGQRLDGIDGIGEDGTAYFAEREMAILRETLNYGHASMRPDESEDCARELGAKYAEYALVARESPGNATERLLGPRLSV